MTPSMTIHHHGTLFCAVWTFYHLALGDGQRNHFVSQVWLRGRRRKYDCYEEACLPRRMRTTLSGIRHLFTCYIVYLKTSMCVATPAAYHLAPAHLENNLLTLPTHHVQAGIVFWKKGPTLAKFIVNWSTPATTALHCLPGFTNHLRRPSTFQLIWPHTLSSSSNRPPSPISPSGRTT